MKRRPIDPEEHALWQRTMQGVARRRRPERAVREIEPVPPAKSGLHRDHESDVALGPGVGRAAGRENTGASFQSSGLDRRTALRLKRGQLAIEARLDLHGMTQAAAHRELAAFVARMSGQGKRVLLVITGKGTKEGSGVLRQAAPRWLDEPGLRGRVLAIAPAVPRDGGDGALYVLLRRER